ncbi:thiamine ABC transporter substrate binding subunit [Otariodibacter sp.]|uniref:thiamine ABC transporter substrate binding subunit n=1 Tax=Otariodibacter sp. TaxID=3030919 RepID=UPI0026167DB0|nr:thiamine ABC transporter substrate binding subunit [Otariodibacter sp.]
MKLTHIFALSSIAISVSVLAANQPTLTVYTYDSFTSEWGPAPKLEAIFEEECNCDLKFMPFEDGVTMFNRIRLEGQKTKADVMLGIDNFVMPEAEKSGLFIPHQLDTSKLDLETVWTDKTFVPYDYGEYAFVYNKKNVTNPPKSLKELIDREDLKIIYQDPRTSTVGRGLLFWVNQVYGNDAEKAWEQLAKHTVTVGKGWSETYGAFLKGESDLVLSYSTSPLYHQWSEQDDSYAAANFDEGHLVQIEVAGITKASKQPELARQFLTFLQTPEAQKIISVNNVMKPVVAKDADPAYSTLPHYAQLPFTQPDVETVKQWLATWQKAMSK